MYPSVVSPVSLVNFILYQYFMLSIIITSSLYKTMPTHLLRGLLVSRTSALSTITVPICSDWLMVETMAYLLFWNAFVPQSTAISKDFGMIKERHINERTGWRLKKLLAVFRSFTVEISPWQTSISFAIEGTSKISPLYL